jgi:hypothetical protein
MILYLNGLLNLGVGLYVNIGRSLVLCFPPNEHMMKS